MTGTPRLQRSWRFVKTLAREYRDTGCRDSAASLTYTTLFAVVPLMTVAFALLRLLPQLQGMGQRIEQLVFENFVPETGLQVQQYLSGFAQQAASLTGIGVLFLLATALFMLVTVERAFNRIWRVHRPRRLLSSLLVYWALLTLGPLLLGTGLAISSWLAALAAQDALGQAVAGLGVWKPVLAVLPFLLTAVFFSLAYVAVPHCEVPLRAGIAGGVVAALLLEGARHLFALVVGGFSAYELVYGAFAAVPLFLLWIYISWAITLFGVVLVYTLVNFEDEEPHPGAAFPALLRVLALFRDRQRQGLPVRDREARHLARLGGIDNWHDYRERLLARRILERDERGNLLLVRDLHDLTLAEVARVLHWEAVARAAAGGEADGLAHEAAARLRAAIGAFDARLGASVAELLEAERPPATPGD